MESGIFHLGNALTVLPTLAGELVDCCVTSPPYWGLRDYGTGTWEGGATGCDHVEKGGGIDSSNLGGGKSTQEHSWVTYGRVCGKCGAVKTDEQIGLEPTPDEYIANLVSVFREVRRVMKEDGTLWVNIGDSYSSGGRTTQAIPTLRTAGHDPASGLQGNLNSLAVRPGSPVNCKAKDLVGIPWMLAFALRADGWYLRQDLIWHKPNPMPESVLDRCTKSHEYLFLLSRSEHYYYDQDAIREASTDLHGRVVIPEGHKATWTQSVSGSMATGRLDEPTDKLYGCPSNGRNKRSVWTIPTSPSALDHYASFPPNLARPCIRAGSRQGGLVLDPFMGTGTTAMVARQEGRGWVGIELNPEYQAMAQARLDKIHPELFAADQG